MSKPKKTITRYGKEYEAEVVQLEGSGENNNWLMWKDVEGKEHKEPITIISTEKSLDNKLIIAALNGNIKQIDSLLADGVSVNTQDPQEGISPLMAAVQSKSTSDRALKTVKHLIAKGANIHAIKNNGYNALIIAAQHGQNEIVKYLINKGAYIHATTPSGGTALSHAAIYGHLAVVKSLILLGAIDTSADRLETMLKELEKHIHLSNNNRKCYKLISDVCFYVEALKTCDRNEIDKFIESVKKEGFGEYLPAIFEASKIVHEAVQTKNVGLLKVLKNHDLVDASSLLNNEIAFDVSEEKSQTFEKEVARTFGFESKKAKQRSETHEIMKEAQKEGENIRKIKRDPKKQRKLHEAITSGTPLIDSLAAIIVDYHTGDDYKTIPKPKKNSSPSTTKDTLGASDFENKERVKTGVSASAGNDSATIVHEKSSYSQSSPTQSSSISGSTSSTSKPTASPRKGKEKKENTR